MKFTTTNLLIMRALNSHTHTINSTSGGMPVFGKIFITSIILLFFIAFGLFVYGEIINAITDIKYKIKYGWSIDPDNIIMLLFGLSFELILIGMLLLLWFVW